MEQITVKTSRFGRRFEMRRRKNFGWEWTQWQNKSSTTYTGSTVYVDYDNGTGRVEDHYDTKNWSEITFVREESDFNNIGKIKLLEGVYRFFRRIRIIATWVFVALFVASFIYVIFNDVFDGFNIEETLGMAFVYDVIAIVLSQLVSTIFYYYGKSVVKKERK